MAVKIIRNQSALLALAMLLVCIAPALAQDAQSPKEGASIEQLWSDLLHYVKVARPIAAQSYGQAILDSDVAPQEIYLLSVKTPGSMATLAKGARLEGMSDIVEQIGQLISKGYESDRSNPEQISHSIQMLGGTLRAIKDASDRLENSGEYALPQLIQTLRNPETPISIKHKVSLIFPRIGKDAVRGLSVALQTTDPKLKELLLTALAEISYPHAAPRIKQLIVGKDLLDRTRRLGESALLSCSGRSGRAILDKSLAEVFYGSALSYYYGADSILPDSRYDTANVWYWEEGLGLIFRPVPVEIFNDVYAMRMSRLALESDPTYYQGVSLWLASYLRRQANLPEGKVDPLLQETTPSPRFFALASPARYLQDVLARAMKDRNSAVALGAIEALAKTAGAMSLVKPIEGGSMPLVEAMSFPDKQVRYLAALSLANAQATSPFTGSDQVISVLTEILRQTGKKTVLLVGEDLDIRNSYKDAIRSAGYDVIDFAVPLEAISAAREAVGVDVAVVTGRPLVSLSLIALLRAESVLATLPVLVVSDSMKARSVVDADERAMAIDQAGALERMESAISEAMKLGIGKGLTGQDVDNWIIQACKTIQMLGRSDSNVYDISRARGALIDVVAQRSQALMPAVGALEVMGNPQAQATIAGLALAQDVDEATQIKAYGALSGSGRRFGNLLTDEPIEAIIAVVGDSEASMEIREAAAQALGVLSLPSEKVMSLILETGQVD